MKTSRGSLRLNSSPTLHCVVKLVPTPIILELNASLDIVPVKVVNPVVLLPSPASYQYGWVKEVLLYLINFTSPLPPALASSSI